MFPEILSNISTTAPLLAGIVIVVFLLWFSLKQIMGSMSYTDRYRDDLKERDQVIDGLQLSIDKLREERRMAQDSEAKALRENEQLREELERCRNGGSQEE